MNGTIAFLSMDHSEGYFIYDELCREPLAELGWQLETVSWCRPGVEWSRYTAVVIRSTWDYHQRLPEFLATLEQISRHSLLLNPLELVRWNADKRYLKDLDSLGAEIVPTLWGRGFQRESLLALPTRLKSAEIVIKPRVSANAMDTVRVTADELGERAGTLLALYAGRDWMAQPFMRSVVDEGETSLFYFGGEFSHAVLKTPRAGDFRVQEEHGGLLRAVEAEVAMHEAAEIVMDAIPIPPVYARVDLVRSPGGRFQLMELELIEPSLYFALDGDAPARFARALDRRLASR
ncbi:MAG: hypothetical protein KDC10_01290 [Calditrichaeota bacterium]|nr:hypothetical protein [Calditrichota bacterium]